MSTFASYFKLAGLCYVQSPLTDLLPHSLLQSLLPAVAVSVPSE